MSDATITYTLRPDDVALIARIAYDSVSAMRRAFGEPPRLDWTFQTGAIQHDMMVIVRRVGLGTIREPRAIHEQWRDEMHKAGVTRDPSQSWTLEICDWGELPPEAHARYTLLFDVITSCFRSMAAIITARAIVPTQRRLAT